MKIALAVLSLLALGAGELAAATDVPRLAHHIAGEDQHEG